MYLVVNTLLHIFYGRSFARVQQFGNCHAGRILVAHCMRLQALSMCVCETQKQIIFECFTVDQLLLLMSQFACRPTCVERGAGAAAVVGSGRSTLGFFKPKSATDGAKESPVDGQ